MPFVTIQVYQTIVVDRVATGDSQLVTLTINDADGDGAITTAEWQAYTGDPNGWLRGTTATDPEPALWEGAGTGNTSSGTLYTAVPYDSGTNLTSVLDDLVQNKFSASIAALTVCYSAGTMVATPDGQRAVENLRPGDLVMTVDHGPQPLVWTGRSTLTPEDLDLNPNQRPIAIAAGALGGDLPRRTVTVSAQHRVLVRDAAGCDRLAAAAHLYAAGMPGFTALNLVEGADLVHLACAGHEILLAEGAPMESFYTGPMAIRALDPVQRGALFCAFPSLAQDINPMQPARPFLTRREVVAMVRETAAAA